MKEIKFSKDIENKIKYIKDIENDSCKYLSKAYDCYILSSKYEQKINCFKEDEYLITHNEKLDNILKYCKENNLIFISTCNNNVRKNKILELSKKYNIKYIDDIQFQKLTKKNVKNILDNTNNIGFYIDIDLDIISDWYNWNVNIENNFCNMIKKFDSYSIEEIQKEPEKITNNCILINEDKNIKYSNEIEKILTKIKKLEILNFKNKWITNIYSNLKNNWYILDVATAIYSLKYNNKEEINEWIYDYLCKRLKIDIEKYNYCQFIQNKCIAQRANAPWPETEFNGCCHNVKVKKDCEYLKDTKCQVTCISCLLFTCRFLKDRGVDYDIHKNLLVKLNFNIIQKPEFIWNFFTPKEQILKNINKYTFKLK